MGARPKPMDDGQKGHRDTQSRVFILLATYNGAPYLYEQLASLVAQTHQNWHLYWRDDGSRDGTLGIMERFEATGGAGRCTRVAEPSGRVGSTASFLTMLVTVVPQLQNTDVVAFADQDDVWLPEKLSRGLEMLAQADRLTPALYCARLQIVNERLEPIGKTAVPACAGSFPASLTENIAAGCTMMLNQRAATLITEYPRPKRSVHDWWSYIAVSAAGGAVLVDAIPVVLYRQHGTNLIGLARSDFARAIAAVRRGPRPFMDIMREHVETLATRPDLLSGRARLDLERLHSALRGSLRQKLATLYRLRALRRHRWLETWFFRLWFLLG